MEAGTTRERILYVAVDPQGYAFNLYTSPSQPPAIAAHKSLLQRRS